MFSIKLLPEEKTICLFRQSLLVIYLPLLFLIILAVYPILLFEKYNLIFQFWKYLSIWIFGLFVFGFYKYILWLLSVVIVTNQRLIYIKYFGVFSKKVLDPKLQSITHISVESAGIKSIFKIHTLSLDIGGASQPILIQNLGSAETLKQTIQNTSVWEK